MHHTFYLRVFSLIAACCVLLSGLGARAQSRQVAVLLYDGKLPEQVALEGVVREAVEPSAAKVELRVMHAGRAETVPFLKRHGFTRKNTPLLLLMDGTGPDARIRRKVYLDPERDPRQNVRLVLSVLKLPPPPAEPPQPGPVITLVADGGDAEKKLLYSAVGNQKVVEGKRHLEPAGVVIYRLRLPDELRYADLRAEVAGSFGVDWADTPNGPWTVLADSQRYFGVGAQAVTGSLSPVVKLDPVLEKLTGDLFLRVRPSGRISADLVRLGVVARAPADEGGERAWLAEVARLRMEALAKVAPDTEKHHQIGGRISSSTTLLAADSPYLLHSDLTVGPSATLTIEPGTTIRIPHGLAIRVLGKLVAKGQPKDPIQFLAAAPGQADDWKGLFILPAPNQPAAEGSVLEYCRIANASTVELRRFAGEVSHCVFENGLAGLTLRDGGSGRIHHNRFKRCVRGLVVQGGAGEVTQNEWIECSIAVAVSQLDPKQPLQFERNSILGKPVGAVTYFKVQGQEQPPLRLSNNHWGAAETKQLLQTGLETAEVVFEPTLPEPPADAGPGW